VDSFFDNQAWRTGQRKADNPEMKSSSMLPSASAAVRESDDAEYLTTIDRVVLVAARV